MFCKEMLSKTDMSKHLVKEIKQQEKVAKQKNCKSYLVMIEPDKRYYGKNDFFLYLWVDGNETMGDIDDLLRGVWLECCHHLSGFTDPSKKRKRQALRFTNLLNDDAFSAVGSIGSDEEEEIMDMEAKDILEKGKVLEYQYDYGSTTYLTLKVVAEFDIAVSTKEMLLSRNEPLEILCDECKTEVAVKVCAVDGMTLCSKCAKKHKKECEDFADYAAMPIVNSPRMGVCGYSGGAIDKKRDGVFKKQS